MYNEEYFKQEEFRELLADYKQAVNTGQLVFMDVDDLGDIADYYEMNGRHEDAQKAIDRALELEPDSIFAWNYRIHEALEKNDYNTAEEYLQNIHDEEAPEYMYCRVEIWLAQGQTEKAEEYLDECVKVVPKDEFQDFIADVLNLYAEYDYLEIGMKWMAQQKSEDSDDFKELQAQTYFSAGKYDDSERLFNELLDEHPFKKQYWYALANTQFMKEEYDASVASSEYAIAIDPDYAEGLLSKANGLFRLENNEEAMKYYKRYLKKVPDDDYALLYMGCCLMNMGCYDKAVKVLLEAEKVANNDSPTIYEIYQELALTYGYLGKVKEAMAVVNKLDKLDCDHNEVLVLLGHIQLMNDMVDESGDNFDKAMRKSAFSPHIIVQVAVSLSDCQHEEQAYKFFKLLYDLIDSKYPHGHAYMALCCLELKKYDEFLYYVKQAVAKDREEAAIVLKHLFPDLKPEQFYEYAQKNIVNESH